MILRSLSLVGGLALGAGTSQFPEFSQQYAQRLGGAVSALSQVVADFDASASAEGLSRAAALEQMRGTAFIERRRTDMERTFSRYETLSADLHTLEGQGPFMRAFHAARMTDTEVAGAAWEAFEPAVPLNFAGLVFACSGFLAGAFATGGVLALLRAPFRMRRRRHA
jgi:hypothetical protein